MYLLKPDRIDDERGFFARVFVKEEFEARGLDTRLAQCAVSYNRHKGTLRGLHYQASPNEQAKLVRCSRGSLYDVVVDLRHNSPTHLHWVAIELDAADLSSIYVPAGLAHGFLTLEDKTEVEYLISTRYRPESERGLRWNDPRLGISWPLQPTTMSDRDQNFPLLRGKR